MSIIVNLTSDSIYKIFVEEFFRHSKFKVNRGEFDGSSKEKWAGKFGEAVVRKEIGLDLNWLIKTGFQEQKENDKRGYDCGVDILWDVVCIDVKTSITNMHPDRGISGMCCHNYKLSQAQDPKNITDVIIFNYFNIQEQMIAICGGISKQEIIDDKNYSTIREKGEKKIREFSRSIHKYSATQYEIYQHQLIQFGKTEDLKGYIYAYGQYKKGASDNFQRAKKKRIFEYPEEGIHRGDGIFTEVSPGYGQENNNFKKGERL